MTDDTRSTLLRNLRGQRAEAWQELVTNHSPILYALCRRQGLAAEDARDLVQQVFVKVFQKIDQFQHRRCGSFRTWLRSITRTTAIDFFRQAAVRPIAAKGGTTARNLLEAVAEESDMPTNDAAVSAGVCKLIERSKSKFTSNTWSAFWRVVVEGQDQFGVAQDLGMTYAAVRQAKCRVLKALREEIQAAIE